MCVITSPPALDSTHYIYNIYTDNPSKRYKGAVAISQHMSMSRGLPLLLRNRTFQLAGVTVPSLYLYSTISTPKTINNFTTMVEKYTPRHSKFPYTEKDFLR
jgi:hypothetical protein